MALDDLSIVIDVLDSFSDDIDELLADLEAVDVQADRVDDIYINLHTLGEDEIAKLQAELGSLTDKELTIETDIDGEGELLSYAALKEAVAADEISKIDFEERGLDEIISKLAVANSEALALKSIASGTSVGGGAGVNTPARGDMDEGGILNLRMSDLHNMLAKLIPLIVVYIGALPAAIAGVAALGAAAVSAAAALGALGGLAGLGFALQAGDGDVMEGLSQIAERVQEDFMDAFEPLARELAPLFEDALNGLEQTFDALASHGDILIGLQDEARAFGRFMSKYVVGTAASMGQMAEAAAPMFALLGESIENANLLEKSAGFLAEMLPALINFGQAMFNILSTITQLSKGFLVAATIFTEFIDDLLFVISGFGYLEKQVGLAIGAILGLITVLSILSSAVLASVATGLFSMATQLIWMARAGTLASFVSMKLSAALQVLRANALAAAVSFIALTGGLAALGMLAGWIGSQFLDTSSAIDEATSSLEEFQDIQGDLDGTGSGTGSNVYQFTAETRNTTINAQNVQDGYRTMNSKEFSQNNRMITD